MQTREYKDKCDCCQKMKVCKGYHELLLCEDCKKEEQEKECNIICDKDNQEKFDF